MKTAIIIISDPKSGEEALARLFNAFALAVESKKAGDELAIIFTGTGTRWPEELANLTHPANGIYQEVQENVVGASHGCATSFGTAESLEKIGVPLLGDNAVSDSVKVFSIRQYLADGWKTVLF